MGNPLRGAGVTVLDCACAGDAQRMDLDRVTVAIDCTVCTQIALKGEGHIDHALAALREAERQAPVALECGCRAGGLNLDRVAVIVRCGMCGRVALGIANSGISSAISTLEFLRVNVPENLRYQALDRRRPGRGIFDA